MSFPRMTSRLTQFLHFICLTSTFSEVAEGLSFQAGTVEDELIEALAAESSVAVECVAVEKPVVAQAIYE